MASFHQSYSVNLLEPHDHLSNICNSCPITVHGNRIPANHARRDATRHDVTKYTRKHTHPVWNHAEPTGVSRFKANITRCCSAILISPGTRDLIKAVAMSTILHLFHDFFEIIVEQLCTLSREMKPIGREHAVIWFAFQSNDCNLTASLTALWFRLG